MEIEELADTHAAEGALDTGVNSGAEIGNEPPEKPQSIREALTASIKEVGDKEQRARDIASGKFIPKEPKEASADKTAAAPETPATEQNVQPTTLAGPPSSWSKESKATWDSLPAQVKADAIKREADVAKGFEEYRGKTAQFQEISQAFAPVRQLLQQSGIQNEAQAVKRLLEWEGSFRDPNTRMQAFHNLARQYGIDPSTLAQRSDQPAGGQDAPEYLRPVLDQFGQLSQTVNTLQSEIQSSRQEKIAAELSTFASDPKHQHFDKVRESMGQLMAAGLVASNDLEAAYQKAVWSDPDLRDQLLREQDEQRKAEFAKTQAAQAKNARLAAVSPPPRARQGAPASPGGKNGKDVRASLMASIAELREDTRA